MATFHWTKNGEFRPALGIADLLLRDPHDLVQKAVGWMLREVGKRDLEQAEAFLATRYQSMPCMMLRYAVEHFAADKRQRYLKGQV